MIHTARIDFVKFWRMSVLTQLALVLAFNMFNRCLKVMCYGWLLSVQCEWGFMNHLYSRSDVFLFFLSKDMDFINSNKSICKLQVCLSIYLSIYLSVCWSVYLSVCLSIKYLSNRLSDGFQT